MSIVSLSYYLAPTTPLYGNNGSISIEKISEISKGKTSNNSLVSMPLHSGTHIDFPKHFFTNGQTLEDYNPDFWFFSNPLILNIEPKSFVIKNEITELIEDIGVNTYDILIINTGSGNFRNSERYISENYGIHPDIADSIRRKLPNIRVLLLDMISVSSYTDRKMGREAHKMFLNPENPILIVEDANLEGIKEKTVKNIIISPLNIAEADGAPCTIYAVLE